MCVHFFERERKKVLQEKERGNIEVVIIRMGLNSNYSCVCVCVRERERERERESLPPPSFLLHTYSLANSKTEKHNFFLIITEKCRQERL